MPGWRTHHPAQALATEGRKKAHALSRKGGLEQVKGAELHLPAKGKDKQGKGERIKGRGARKEAMPTGKLKQSTLALAGET